MKTESWGITISIFPSFWIPPFLFHPTLVPFLHHAIYMLFCGNYHSTHALFNNQTRVFEGKEVLLLNPSTTRFATHFLLMMRTLYLKNALRGTVHFQKFISLKLRKEEGTLAMVKCDQYFHQRHIFIKTAKPLLILLRMAESNQPQMYKLRFMVLMVYDHTRMSMTELNYEDYFPPRAKSN